MVTPGWQGNSNSLSSLSLLGYCCLVSAKEIAVLWVWQKQSLQSVHVHKSRLYISWQFYKLIMMILYRFGLHLSSWLLLFHEGIKKGKHRPFNAQIPERQSLVGNDVSVKHISPRVRFALLCFRRQFISSEVIRALRISAHQIQLMDGINPGAGPRNDSLKKGKKKKKSAQYFPKWSEPIPLRAVINIEHYISCMTGSPRWVFLNAATGRRDSPQRERLKLKHASFFNIVLKWNWLHLDRHGDKSRRHLAEAGFIADGGESPSLQSIIFLPTIESSIIAQWWSYCAAGADRLGEWIMAVQRVEGVVKHFSFLFFIFGVGSGAQWGQVM